MLPWHLPFLTCDLFLPTYAVLGTSLLSLGLIDDLEYVGAVLAVVGFGCGVGLAAAAVLITLRFSASKKLRC